MGNGELLLGLFGMAILATLFMSAVSAFALGVGFLQYRGKTTSCPNCGHAKRKPSRKHPDPPCLHCFIEIASNDANCRFYCGEGSLHETAATTKRRIFYNMMLMYFVALWGAPALLIFVISGILSGFTLGLLIGVVGSAGFVLPISLAFAVSAVAQFSLARPTIAADNGVLRVWQGPMAYRDFPLSDCEWHVGSAMYAYPFLLGKVILITPQVEGAVKEVFLPVGFTEESFAAWEQLLTHEAGTRRTAWERRISPMRTAVNAVSAILSVPVCIGGGFAAAFLTMHVLTKLTNDPAIGEMVGESFFVTGVVALLYWLLLWPWYPGWRVPTTRSLRTQWNIRLFSLFIFLLLYAGKLAVPMLMWDQRPLHARLIGAALAIALGLFFGWDLGRRVAKYERAKQLETDTDKTDTDAACRERASCDTIGP